MHGPQAKATKNICYVKGEGAVNLRVVTRWFKKFSPGCKNLDTQAKSDKPKTKDFKAVP